MEDLSPWARKGVFFSWVVDVGILLDFSSVSFGGEIRLVERELLLLVAESVVVCCGGVLVSEFELELELEFEGSGAKSSESLL
jgi:hypothetical protein